MRRLSADDLSLNFTGYVKWQLSHNLNYVMKLLGFSYLLLLRCNLKLLFTWGKMFGIKGFGGTVVW